MHYVSLSACEHILQINEFNGVWSEVSIYRCIITCVQCSPASVRPAQVRPNEHFVNHIPLKEGMPKCNAESPTAWDTFRAMQDLITVH